MSDTTFTPGPWTMSDSGFVRGAEYGAVACVYGDDPECHPDKRMFANGRLIVAAPDLYAYAERMAATGDTEAKMLLQKINGEQA